MAWTRELAAELPLRVRKSPFAFLLRGRLLGRSPAAHMALREGNARDQRATWLAELHGDVAVAIRGDDPGGGHVVVWAEDVGTVIGAVHEHRVELSVVDALRPPADVLARLVTQTASEVDVRPVGVGDEALGSHAVGVADRDVVEARAPGQWTKTRCSAILIDQRLLRGADDDWRRSRWRRRRWRSGSRRSRRSCSRRFRCQDNRFRRRSGFWSLSSF